MPYVLNSDIALRSWRLVPCAYYVKNERNAYGLSREEFNFLLQCDGCRELEPTPLAKALKSRGLIHEALDGEQLGEWNRLRICDNRYFPAMNWMITGKCNYNCLHCFNAADNAPLMSEWSLPQAEALLSEAERCGINALTLTGGEPMCHPQFFDILKAVVRHGMYVEELNTNGFYITRSALKTMREIGCEPLMKISFDGLGYHDWMRSHKGAEERTLRAIQLCVEEGFRVKVQTNVNRKNIEAMLPTAQLLNDMCVKEMRIIRTTEAPRWVENAKGMTLELLEYYDKMIEFAQEYAKTPHRMTVDIWQLMTLYPQRNSYRLRTVECDIGEYRDTLPVCRGNRGMIAVEANGTVVPCMQMSGYYEAHNDVLGNVKTDGLQPLLQSGRYLCEVCTTVGELAAANLKCGQCSYFKHCVGGCRAIAIALTGNKLGCDPSKCLFFENGYYKKITAAMTDWRNLSPIQLL